MLFCGLCGSCCGNGVRPKGLTDYTQLKPTALNDEAGLHPEPSLINCGGTSEWLYLCRRVVLSFYIMGYFLSSK